MDTQVALTYSSLLQVIAFYTLTTLGLVSGAGMLLVRNLMHSAYLLVLTFLTVAGTFFLLNADFLGVAQIIIYAAAVAIMVIFGLMLTNKPAAPLATYSVMYRYVALALGVGLFGYACRLATMAPWMQREVAVLGSPVAIGQAFFSEFLVPFEVAAVLLLAALIGALTVARKEA
jgi:NADH:ubiquinone oxidoreductase subunit 6 (subunit J)